LYHGTVEVYMCMHTHTHSLTHTHTHTCARTHTHTHAYTGGRCAEGACQNPLHSLAANVGSVGGAWLDDDYVELIGAHVAVSQRSRDSQKRPHK
jgi:hypothetical protein